MATYRGDEKANKITGKDENDFIYGLAGNDRLIGAVGDDKLYGDVGADTLLGEGGFDYLDGGAGNDFLDGGVGNDGQVNIFHDPAIGIYRWNFAVSPTVGGLLGYAGEDRILGGDGNDAGLGGYDHDTLLGEAGDDVLFGGADADELDGGIGNDVLAGDTLVGITFSDQTIIGGPGGDDIVDGGDGDDLIFGGEGGDTLTGGAGIDYIYGSMGNDSRTAPGFIDGDDNIVGGDGDDVLRGGDGNDTLDGGDDEDNLRGDAGNDVLEGGDGDDLASYRFDDIGLTSGADFSAAEVLGDGADVTIDDGQGGFDRLISIERTQITGSAYGDTFSAGGGDDFVNGNAGDDILQGGNGDDVIDGGAGDDIVLGGLGDDDLKGGADTDIVAYDFNEPGQTTGVSFDGSAFVGPGAAVISGALIGSDRIEGFELLQVIGTDYNDTIVGSGVIDTIRGRAGKDRIEGGAGDDFLYGGDGIDQLVGGDGADTLDGEAGNDQMTGGAGDDIYIYKDAKDTIVEAANGGHDLVRASISLELSANVEDVILEEVSTSVVVFGNALDNVINGNDLTNVLEGRDGNDTLYGHAGNDVLKGGKGLDHLEGGVGDDNYYIQSSDAEVIEQADEGTDRVHTAVSYELGDNVEDLEMEGAKNILGIGNDLDNTIFGNAGRNELSGGDGDDKLWGNGGADRLNGGDGADLFVVPNVADSTGPNYDTIVNPDFRGAGDRFSLGDLNPSTVADIRGGTLLKGSFDADLARYITADLMPAGTAALFNPDAGDYEKGRIVFLIVDANGVGGYQAGEDYVFALQSMRGEPTPADFL